jgi:hypothetical protein
MSGRRSGMFAGRGGEGEERNALRLSGLESARDMLIPDANAFVVKFKQKGN